MANPTTNPQWGEYRMSGVSIPSLATYNLVMGVLSAVGLIYLVYTQRHVFSSRFLLMLGTGFLVFSIGGPLADLFASKWHHLVHGIAALFIVFGLYNPVHNDLRTDEWMEVLLQDPAVMRHPEEWMRPIDESVLELFHSSDLVLTPAIIAYNIEYSSKEVNRRLSELEEHNFVERVERGKYRLTNLGEAYLEGRLYGSGANHPA